MSAPGLREGNAIVRDYLLVPVETLLGSTLQRLIIGLDEPETLAATFSPLEVIHNRPYEISVESHSFLDGSICLGNMVSKESYSVVVLDLAVLDYVVFERGSVFGDIKRWIAVVGS